MTNSPRLRPDLIIVEQSYRGEQSYIVKDPASHKYFRFRPIEALVMQELDGEHTPAQIAAALVEQGFAFTEATVAGFARTLQQMELLERSLTQRSVLQLERLRAERHRRVKRTHYNGSLLRMRWSVGDPDKFFDRWTPRLRFFFSKPFLVLSVALFLTYFTIFVTQWPEMHHAIRGLYTLSHYTLGSFLLLWVTFMGIVVVHEMGHGFTCKYFGGQVNEMGAMLIYFQPAFYCNVNDAWTFPDLRARLWVTAAGSWIQLVLAAIAGLVWLAAAPGTVISQMALNAVLIGGVTTILANANPLIPLDGYYALSDYLEVPNLRQRALAHVGWFVRRHMLRLTVPEPPATDREKRIFSIYGPLALAYSTSILFFIVAAAFGWVSRTIGALGVLAFAFALWGGLRGTLREWARALITSIREHRGAWGKSRRWRMGGAAVVVVLLAGLLVPWPINVGGNFAAVTPLKLAITAPEAGVVAEVYATEGVRVVAGAPLLRLRSLELDREAVTLRRLADSLAGLEAIARVRGGESSARHFAAERDQQQAKLSGVLARLRTLTLRAPVAGVVVTPRLGESVGRWIPRGAVAVRLDDPDGVELRVILERAGATLVRPGQRAALISYADVGRPVRAEVASVSSAAATGGGTDALEARVRVTADALLRSGVTGEAKVTVRRSNLFGALWWGIRKRVRSDLLL